MNYTSFSGATKHRISSIGVVASIEQVVRPESVELLSYSNQLKGGMFLQKFVSYKIIKMEYLMNYTSFSGDTTQDSDYRELN